MIALLLLAQWTNVTGGVGGETWGYAGVTLLAGVPGKDEILAGVSERGLWSSADGGATWRALGKGEIKHRPHQILFDPRDPRVFWVSGCYGPGIFRTDDGGATFRRLGKVDHVDGVAVDFGDPARRTLLTGLHEQARSLHLSRDGGETWEKIGDRLPEDSNHSTDPIILDAKTWLVNTAGWAKGKSHGIYRSADAGATWTKVSDLGPGGRWLRSGASVYWTGMWGNGLVRSADGGATWSKLKMPVKSSVVEAPGGRLLGVGDKQVYASRDEGATWEPVGEPLPVKANGVAVAGGRIYAWRSSDKKVDDAVFRAEWPR